MTFSLLLLLPLLSTSVHENCPDQGNGCTGTAVERSEAAIDRARAVNLNQAWPSVREAIVEACGLKAQASTSHCFNDFNHVDCCTMVQSHTHRTNEDSRVVGMHRVNFLGSHIVDASLPSLGEGGSWCTCHLSSPADVCHKQFGARTAFKLVWCGGSGVAALLDDYGNVLSSGKPVAAGRATIPDYGGASARRDSWRVLDESRNKTWAARWKAACSQVEAGLPSAGSTLGHDEL